MGFLHPASQAYLEYVCINRGLVGTQLTTTKQQKEVRGNSHRHYKAHTLGVHFSTGAGAVWPGGRRPRSCAFLTACRSDSKLEGR